MIAEGRKLRIAHVLLGRCNPDSSNGVDKTVFYLSRAQADLGHDVTVHSITAKPPLPIPGVRSEAHQPSIPSGLSRLRIVGDYALRSPFGLPGSLVSRLKQSPPHVVHFHFVHNLVYPRLAKALHNQGVPYVITPNGGLAIRAQERHALAKRFLAILEKRYFENAAFVHAVSPLDSEGIRAYGVNNRIVGAPNGIDLEQLPRAVDVKARERRFPHLADKRMVVYVGRLDPEQKGLDLLLKALPLVSPSAVLVLAGPDWRGRRRSLEQEVAKHDLQSRVVFLGSVGGAEKYEIMAGADIFVHPSRWEAGIPFSVLEAMAMASACLVTPGADPEGMIEESGAGLRVEAEVQGIAEGLERMMGMPLEELREMGRRGQAVVMERFSWGAIAARMIDGYRRFALAR
jgi:glycosyltransferase involved in cell wall biosynthesis